MTLVALGACRKLNTQQHCLKRRSGVHYRVLGNWNGTSGEIKRRKKQNEIEAITHDVRDSWNFRRCLGARESTGPASGGPGSAWLDADLAGI